MATQIDRMLGSEEALDPDAGVPAEPVRKAVANYRPAEGMEACEGCKHFREPEGCALVLGQISASGVCDLWEPAEGEDLIDGGMEEFLFGGGAV